jgi:hypothetical protein
MKALFCFRRIPGRTALASLAVSLLVTVALADLPVIQSIQVEGTNVVVTARVPPGHARVTLESRSRFGAGAWVPVAVQRPGAQGGIVTFRLPCSGQFAALRVRADTGEPLPASFYTGTNSFADQPASGAGGPLSLMALDAFAATGQSREVVESDIWRRDGDTLYFFNQYRGLQVMDITNPDTATLRGTLNLPAAGEQMYLLRSNYVVLLTRSTCGYPVMGGVIGPWFSPYSTGTDSEVVIVGVTNGVPAIVTRLSVPGAMAESRLVGTALYVASQTFRPVPGSGDTEREWGTQISSFDLADPRAPVTRSPLWYSGYNNVVHATETFFFAVTQHPTNWQQSIVNVIDITAPDGTMHDYDSITPAGQVADKFKLNWSDAILSVISEFSGSRLVTKLETFRLPDPRSLPPITHVKLGEVELGHGERLFATRFDYPRAYVVTFLRIDPLWVVDLSDPAHPTVSGELQVPGWSTYIHPLGNRLVAVGVETNRTTVSLFDVSQPAHPGLLSRVSLGNQYSYSEANQDEKAFTVLEDAGLLLLPVQGDTTNGYRSWVQLIDLGTNSLTARGRIDHEFVPRRATLHRERVISLSGFEFLSVDATDRDDPELTGRLALAWPINRVLVSGNYLIEITTGNGWSSQDQPVVRIASALNPNDVLATLALTNAPIAGVTLRSNRLYLVQAAAPTVFIRDDTNASPAGTLWLTVADVSSLPVVRVLGQTTATTLPFGWNNEFEPLWLKPDLLVWSGGGNNFWWWGPWDIMPLGGFGGWFWPFSQTVGSGRLFAFDVAHDATPALLSEVNLTTNDWWSFSKAFAADGLVYLSHQKFIEPDTNSNSAGLMRNCLDVVDYGDPRQPTVRPPVSIPGTLQGISHNGALLYTIGFHLTSTNSYEGAEALDASAYDGVSAYLVDSVSLSNVWQHPVLVSGTNLFLGRGEIFYDATNHVAPTLETWTLSSAGRFTKLGSVTLPSSASDLVAFPGLLAAQVDWTRVLIFNRTDPAALRQAGEGPAVGCFSFDLHHADAAAGRALWLPLDAYGVTEIGLSP